MPGVGVVVAVPALTPASALDDNLYDFVRFGTPAQLLGHVTFSISFVVIIVRGRRFAIGRDYGDVTPLKGVIQ